MTELLEPTASPDRAVENVSRPILVATDGEPQSRGAIAAAIAFAGALGARVHVIAANWPKTFITPEAPLIFDPALESSRRAELLRRARAQIAACDSPVLTEDAIEVRDGDPSRVISNVALEEQAPLVITGLGRHNVVDRLFGDETALRVMRVAHAPVLAVPETFPVDFRGVPRRGIVAMDFSEGSTRAAQAALQLLPAGSTVELVHVMPREQDLGYALIPLDEYQRSVDRNFALLRRRLTIPAGTTIEERVLAGNPAVELLAHAAETRADLIAAGSHNYGFLARIVIGSVTSKLVRGAACAVLVVPPDAASNTLGSDLRADDASKLDQAAPA